MHLGGRGSRRAAIVDQASARREPRPPGRRYSVGDAICITQFIITIPGSRGRAAFCRQSRQRANTSKSSNRPRNGLSQTFYGTLLKQVRQSPFHSKLFEGGRGGEAFQGMFDQQLADHMVRGTGRKLVNAISRKIEARKAYGNSPRVPHSKHSYENSPSLLRSIHAATALRA